MCPHLFFMGWDAVASCEFTLVSLDPVGAKKSGMKAKKGHMPSRFLLRHLASVTIPGLQEKDGILIHALGFFPLRAENSLPSVSGRPHTVGTAFASNI